MQVTGPGDAIAALPEDGEVRVGAGVIADERVLRTVRAGVTRQTRSGKIWTEGCSKRQALASPSIPDTFNYCHARCSEVSVGPD